MTSNGAWEIMNQVEGSRKAVVQTNGREFWVSYMMDWNLEAMSWEHTIVRDDLIEDRMNQACKVRE